MKVKFDFMGKHIEIDREMKPKFTPEQKHDIYIALITAAAFIVFFKSLFALLA